MPTTSERMLNDPTQLDHLPDEAGDPFAPFRAADPSRPFVIAQLGQSLDGRIATISGESKYINGAPALDHLHRMRAEVDAVIVGASTIVADDPQLTVRRVERDEPYIAALALAVELFMSEVREEEATLLKIAA